MNIDPKEDRLRGMMRAYASPRHTVVATGVRDCEARFISSGTPVSNMSVGDMIFEIGSITKVFTGILLCLLVEEGKVDPHAPLRHMSGDLASVPDWITPERLISHTGGLPNFYMPLWRALLRPAPDGPYAGFRRSDLLAWLHTWRGRASEPRRGHAYSNLGVGLLGEAMAMQQGAPFVDMLAERIVGPLGLRNTTHRLDADQQGRFAHPRHISGRPVPPWRFEALAAAGCLRSSAHDLARFSTRVIQALNTPENSLDRAICRSAEPVFGLGRRGCTDPAAQCSGWLSMKPAKPGSRILHCSGGTAGSTCALYICPEKAEACAVVSNNGIAGSLWGGIRLDWSNQLRQAQGYFEAT